MEFHHVGVATPDAAGVAATLSDLFGLAVAHEERFDGLQIVFLDAGSGYVEALEPTEETGPVAHFLDRRGPGIHHLALRTDDVAASLDAARTAGAEPVDDEPRPGAWGHEVAFLHPDSTGGVLVELVEEGG
ncbi:MAG: methylmalonyl-CoA epimerase [Haloferacaceae archaeon]